MKKIKIETNAKSIKILLITLIILLAIPSIIYILTGNSISEFECNYNYLFQFNINHILDAIIFLTIFSLICLIYVIILKNYKKIFKSKKDIYKFIIIVSALFALILPMTSTDVFYYISTGWSDANYGVNPYYTSVYELKQTNNINDDEILNKIPKVWERQKIVYGPVWPFICKILTFFSFGCLPVALIIFKIFNLGIHILNCILVDKISNKKLFTLIYALNPLILFEGITNVHNDILLIFFILLALYFALKKKNIVLSVISLAIATAIKYVAILIVPFIVIYYFRKEKVNKRILNAIWLALIFIVVLCGIYLLYTRDLQVIQGIFTQQGKYAKSLFLTVYLVISPEIAGNLSLIFMLLFIAFYLIEVGSNLFNKNINLRNSFRKIYTILLIFLLLVITNFQIWYIMWLLQLIMFQNKKAIKSTINLTIASEVACTIFFALGEGYMYGHYFFVTMIILWFIFNKVNFKKFIELKLI